MPIQHYSLFKGWVVERQLATFNNPHYHIHAVDQFDDYRISFNVFSDILFDKNLGFSQVEAVLLEDFSHPVTTRLAQLEPGLYPLDKTANRRPGGLALALDYIRADLFDRSALKPVPFNLPGAAAPHNLNTHDLNENLDKWIKCALADKSAMIYAFGSRWGPLSQPDRVFGFKPARGLCNIHMNQGNFAREFVTDNGIWQDGALLLWGGAAQRWTAFFLKFRQQAWDTWDDSGAPKDQLDQHFRFLKKKERNKKKVNHWDSSYKVSTLPDCPDE